MKSKGLGDTVEKITTATGIKKLVKWVAGEDCGCLERQIALNKLFPYKNPKCLTEEEHIWCKNYFETFRSTINRNDQHKMLDIYNRVFDAKKEASSCGSCVRELYNSVNKLYKTYEE